MTAEDIIRHYKLHFNDKRDTWLIDCTNSKDFLAAVQMAGLARDRNNRKHPHQFRVQNEVLRKFTDRLLKQVEPMLSCNDFEALFKIVDSCRVRGIGPLTVYDTCHRIGANIRVEPQKVYLHQGTRIGTQRYLQTTGLPDFLDRREFRDFRKLSCAAIEDIMCIYKDEFPLTRKSLKARAGRFGC